MDWKDLKLNILGKDIDIKPIEYIDDNKKNALAIEFVGNINILEDEFMSLKKYLPKAKKLSNFQRKKMWKKFYRTFGLTEEQIRFIFKKNR